MERFISAADALSKHKVLAAVMKACGGLEGLLAQPPLEGAVHVKTVEKGFFC